MAQIEGRQTINEVEILEVDQDPSLGVGTPAPIGSLALVQGAVGSSYIKFGSGDTEWILQNIVNPKVDLPLLEDFITQAATSNKIGQLSWNVTAGGGSVAPDTSLISSRHFGIIKATSGNAGNVTGIDIVNQLFIASDNKVVCNMIVNIPTLATVAQDFVLRFGLGSNINTSDFTNGVYFESNRSVGANWLAKTAKSGIRTTTNTGVPLATGWETLQWIYDPSTVSVKFYIGSTPTLVATNTLNIPDTSSNIVGPIMMVHNTAGNTGKIFYADLFNLLVNFGGVR